MNIDVALPYIWLTWPQKSTKSTRRGIYREYSQLVSQTRCELVICCNSVVSTKGTEEHEERGTVMIRQGKGRKDRMTAIGDRAIKWIQKYRHEVRPELVREPDCGTLFLTNLFEPFTPNRLTQLVRDYIKAADLGKTGACHLLRHTCATLMLENGADTRFIQQQLGHARLDTTQIYTQVSIRKLKEIHTATHPAKLR